jgi:hypothetical protein
MTYQRPSAGGGGGAPTNAQYVTLATNGTLTGERVLTAGTGITITDAGAGSTVTIAATGGSGTTVRSGSATVDFGSPTEDGFASVAVTGQTWVTADAIIHAKAAGIASADHDADDAAVECISCHVGTIVVGDGFTITAGAPNGTWGRYTIQWMGIDP